MFENCIGLIGLMMILAQIGANPALAAETLSRKPGLWEVKTSIENSNGPVRVIRQCIDLATDQMLQSSAGPFDPAACPQRDVQRSDEAATIDSVCKVAGKPVSARAVISGSFDSAYKMTVTAQGEALPGGKMVMTMDAKWLGPCAADQKPGDIIMSNGAKINLPDMMKRGPSPIDPMAPH